MIKVKGQKVRGSDVTKVFNSLKKHDLLEDRAEYDKEDLQDAYPQLNEKEIKLLYLKVQKWKYSKTGGNRKIALNDKLS